MIKFEFASLSYWVGCSGSLSNITGFISQFVENNLIGFRFICLVRICAAIY